MLFRILGVILAVSSLIYCKTRRPSTAPVSSGQNLALQSALQQQSQAPCLSEASLKLIDEAPSVDASLLRTGSVSVSEDTYKHSDGNIIHSMPRITADQDPRADVMWYRFIPKGLKPAQCQPCKTLESCNCPSGLMRRRESDPKKNPKGSQHRLYAHEPLLTQGTYTLEILSCVWSKRQKPRDISKSYTINLPGYAEKLYCQNPGQTTTYMQSRENSSNFRAAFWSLKNSNHGFHTIVTLAREKLGDFLSTNPDLDPQMQTLLQNTHNMRDQQNTLMDTPSFDALLDQVYQNQEQIATNPKGLALAEDSTCQALNTATQVYTETSSSTLATTPNPLPSFPSTSSGSDLLSVGNLTSTSSSTTTATQVSTQVTSSTDTSATTTSSETGFDIVASSQQNCILSGGIWSSNSNTCGGSATPILQIPTNNSTDENTSTPASTPPQQSTQKHLTAFQKTGIGFIIAGAAGVALGAWGAWGIWSGPDLKKGLGVAGIVGGLIAIGLGGGMIGQAKGLSLVDEGAHNASDRQTAIDLINAQGEITDRARAAYRAREAKLAKALQVSSL